ncbi:hypothetical protein E2C01_094430 [Portunus trituberculatus]|uniref:Uncharacterized protein n=1 Tax=Portunus trituberculatus TaxID=210409 RepID=A0A5B7JXK2_PORTR|nr:hypothetical protein [Portunus trituberculatus]
MAISQLSNTLHFLPPCLLSFSLISSWISINWFCKETVSESDFEIVERKKKSAAQVLNRSGVEMERKRKTE